MVSERNYLYLLTITIPSMLLLIMFWEPLTTSRMLFHPDWGPFFEATREFGIFGEFIYLGWSPNFMYFLWAVLPDKIFYGMFFPIHVMAIFGVLYVWLRNQKLPRIAATAGALSGAFAGYMLTLVSAGHRGIFEAVLSCVIMLLCVDGVVQGKSIWYGIAGALAVAFTLTTQPDVMILLGVFVAAYGITSCWWHWTSIKNAKGHFSLTLVVSIIVFLLSAIPAIFTIRDAYLPMRKAQIASSDRIAVEIDVKEKVLPSAQWEFATNWSLPLRDTPEFILPLFFGTESSDRTAPFWGELGRSLDWKPEHPSGFRNFRQHSVYMGLLQVLLAVYACGCVFSGASRKTSLVSAEERRQILFWLTCAIVALLLSFGRYTPFYRLFYALPLADFIRAPVKFFHVVNLSLAILTAYGVTFLLRGSSEFGESAEICAIAKKSAKLLAWFCGGLAGVFLCGVLIVNASADSLTSYWTRLGFDPSLHATMLQHMFIALWRSCGLAAGLGLCIYALLLRRTRHMGSLAIGICICGAIGLDMSLTAKRFVNTIDLSVHESKNAAVNDIRSLVAPRLLDLLTSRNPNDPVRINLQVYHANAIRLLDNELPDYASLLTQVGNDFGKLVLLLQVTSTEYVLGRREQLNPWLQSGAFDLKGYYDFANGIVPAANPHRAPITLLRLRQALPRAVWVPSVRYVDEEDSSLIFDSSFNPNEEVMTQTGSLPKSTDASIRKRKDPIAANVTAWSRWHVVIDGLPPEGGILLLNDPYHIEWKAYVDKRRTHIAKANMLMMAIDVPPNSGKVEFHRRPGLRFLYVSTLPSFILFALILVKILLWGIRKVNIADVIESA